jgi:glycine/D-amino acid oxidase-like deaminating enzyme
MVLRVAIVGGGAIGSAIAFFLASHPRFTGEVAVIERDPTYKVASSALSASAIRQRFFDPVNIELSRFEIAFLRNIGRYLSVHGGTEAQYRWRLIVQTAIYRAWSRDGRYQRTDGRVVPGSREGSQQPLANPVRLR